jgi:hypothetical protein
MNVICLLIGKKVRKEIIKQTEFELKELKNSLRQKKDKY